MWDQLLSDAGVTGAPKLIEWVAIAIGLGLATFIGRLNMIKGRASPRVPAVGEIAGAIIDKETADQIVAAVKRQTEETVKNSSAIRANVRAIEMLSARLENNTDEAAATRAMIDEARKDIRRLTDEMIRGK